MNKLMNICIAVGPYALGYVLQFSPEIDDRRFGNPISATTYFPSFNILSADILCFSHLLVVTVKGAAPDTLGTKGSALRLHGQATLVRNGAVIK